MSKDVSTFHMGQRQEASAEMDFAETILNSMAEGVFTVDENMVITSFNYAAEQITGYKRSEVMGKQCHEILRSDICSSFCPIREALRTGEPIKRELEIITRYHKKITVAVNASVLYDRQRKIVGAVETFRDLSLVYSLQKEIK